MMKKFIILVCFMYFISFGFFMSLEDCHEDVVRCNSIAICYTDQQRGRLECDTGSDKPVCYIKVCYPNPCNNGATCTATCRNRYLCTCATGWTGVHCETDIDDCASKPCLNGAKCTDTGRNSFLCTCATGWTGVHCETDMTSEKVSASSIAIAASVSFLAGGFTVLIALFLLRHVRERKGCFRKDNQSREEKWEGASQPVTKKVLEQHTADVNSQPADKGKIYSKLNHSNDATEHIYDKSQDTYETLKDKGNRDSHLYSTTQSQSQYESLSDAGAVKYGAGNEHVYTGITGQSRADKPYAKTDDDTERNQDKRRDHLFEESRDSSASAHNYVTLQNDNFRDSEQTGDEAKQVNENGKKEGHTYFTLQKENTHGAQTPEKTNLTENAYFTLERESGKGELTPKMTNTTNADFALETEEKDYDPQAAVEDNIENNNYFVLEKA